MDTLSEAFSKKENLIPETSLLGRLFSSPLIRGFYRNRTPEVPLRLEGSKTEQKRLTYLINTIACNSATGRKILEDAAKNGYTLGFEHVVGCYGACNSEEKILTLNPYTDDEKLITTLTHEARHAQQNEKGVPLKGMCDIATEVRLQRACEADAQAAAAQTALEIRAATKDPSVWYTFANAAPEIASAVEELSPSYENAQEFQKQQDKIMTAAFKGWFDNIDLLTSYENNYLASLMMLCNEAPENLRKSLYDKMPFSRHMTSEEITGLLCVSASGKCYLEGEKDILNNPKMCAVSQSTKSIAAEFFYKRREDINQPEDTGFHALPTYGSSYSDRYSSFSGGYYDLKKTSAVASVLAAKRQR